MEALVKETTTVHRTWTKHLTEGTVQMIMLPVVKDVKGSFGAAWQTVELETESRFRGNMLSWQVWLKTHANANILHKQDAAGCRVRPVPPSI